MAVGFVFGFRFGFLLSGGREAMSEKLAAGVLGGEATALFSLALFVDTFAKALALGELNFAGVG
jgi:hypothetical protein